MNSSKTLISILAAGVLLASLAACQKKEEVAIDQGPAETAGQKIDEVTTNTAEKVDEAAANTEQKVDETAAKIGEEADKAKAYISDRASTMTDAAGKKIEEAGVKLQDAAK